MASSQGREPEFLGQAGRRGALKVLMFSVVDYSNPGNGGGLWAANLLDGLSLVPDVEFVVACIGEPATSRANEDLVRGLGFEHVFVPFRKSAASARAEQLGRKASAAISMLQNKYYFEWELESRWQRHVDGEIGRIIDETRPDLILVGYLFSALFAPSIFGKRVPVCLVSLNKEAEFHKSLRAVGGPTGQTFGDRAGRWLYRHFNGLANFRIDQYEKRVYGQCAAIVALTEEDLPRNASDHHVIKQVFPPVFKPNALRWSERGNRNIFYVGNIAHYPNRLAVEWLCLEFAPHLQRMDPTIRIDIIGASVQQVPAEWRLPNIRFMGVAGKGEVVELMTTAGLFIAPIANRFGAKIKLAECLSYGTPFIATDAAMSGLPFLKGIPLFSLEAPSKAAELAVSYLNNREALSGLSESTATQAQGLRMEQAGTWRTLFLRSIEAYKARTP